MDEDELFVFAKNIQAPFSLVQEVAKTGRLPVVNFAAGGIATPADAALMMQLGVDGESKQKTDNNGSSSSNHKRKNESPTAISCYRTAWPGCLAAINRHAFLPCTPMPARTYVLDLDLDLDRV